MHKVFEDISKASEGRYANGVLYAGAVGLILSDIVPTPADALYFYSEKRLRDKWKAGEITPKQYWERTAMAYYLYNPIWWTLVLGALYYTKGDIKQKVKIGVGIVGIGAVIGVIYRNYTQDIKGIKQSWWERDIKSQKRNRVLFGMEQDDAIVISDKYNFGKVRTLSEYERYAGVKFSTKEVCIYTLSGKLAPTPYNENYVDGHDPITLSIISVSPSIDLNPSILNNKSANKLTVSVYDDRNRLIQVNTFGPEIIGLWQNRPDKVSFNVHLQLLADNKNLHYEVKSYDIMGRELGSYKNKLSVDV